MIKFFSPILLCLLPAFSLLAGPMEDTFGAGARNKALAGAGVSIAEDYTATFYNPSLLAFCRGSRLSLGYDYVQTNLASNPHALQLGSYSSMNLGFCLKPLNQIGIGLYSNFSMGPIQFNANTLSTDPIFILYAGDLKTFSMIMSLGYAPFKWLSFGAGMSFATSVSLGADLDISPSREPPVIAKFPAEITPIVGAILGVTGIPLEHWKLSLVYRSATYGQIDIKATAKLGTITPPADSIIQGFLSYSPHQIALGSSYLLDKKWLFSGDLTYYFWSKYPGPFLQISSSAGSLIPNVEIAKIEPPNFSDIIVPRFGVEYSVWDKLQLRAGYSFRPTPAPTPTGKARLLDADAHRISMGVGYEFQLYQNIFLFADGFLAADILQNSRGAVVNTGILLGAEYD